MTQHDDNLGLGIAVGMALSRANVPAAQAGRTIRVVRVHGLAAPVSAVGDLRDGPTALLLTGNAECLACCPGDLDRRSPNMGHFGAR